MFLSVFLNPTKLTTKMITPTIEVSFQECHPFSLKTMGLLEYLNKNFRIPLVVSTVLASDALLLLISLLADYVPVSAYATWIPRGVIASFSWILSEVLSD